MRGQLLKQFNAVLQTRDTARGLIVNMSDVLFDTGKFTLRPCAGETGQGRRHRRRASRLKLDVEGHTDSVGGDEYNQQLSEDRGGAVRDYLTQAGMAAVRSRPRVSARLNPWLPMTLLKARQLNRRVELVISGDVIGTDIGAPVARR